MKTESLHGRRRISERDVALYQQLQDFDFEAVLTMFQECYLGGFDLEDLHQFISRANLFLERLTVAAAQLAKERGAPWPPGPQPKGNGKTV